MPAFKHYRVNGETVATKERALELAGPDGEIEEFTVQVDMVLTEMLPDGTQPMRLSSAIFCF